MTDYTRFSVAAPVLCQSANHAAGGGFNALGIADVVVLAKVPGPPPTPLAFAWRLWTGPGAGRTHYLSFGLYGPDGTPVIETGTVFHAPPVEDAKASATDHIVPLLRPEFTTSGTHLLKVQIDSHTLISFYVLVQLVGEPVQG